MIESVKNYLLFFNSSNENVLKAMEKIDRKDFYPSEMAYNDIAQTIPCGQTISQPSTVGRMLDLLKVEKGNSVLEIGTGSGWCAGLLAFLATPGKVVSIEIHEELLEYARKNLSKYNLPNLETYKKDFRDVKTTFDRIIFTCGIQKNKEKTILSWISRHLNKDGHAVCPYEEGPLMIITKKDKELKIKYTKEEYTFVPLV